jgi:hypothetical protein
MPVETYDETSLGNGPVPRTGTRGGAAPASQPGAVGTPNIRTADGTESPRTTVTTKMAAPLATPTGGRKGWPKAVTSYPDGV